MARYVVTIETDNAAFEDAGVETEIARILRGLANDVEQNHPDWTRRPHTPRLWEVLRDRNGNAVGHAELIED